MGRLMPRAIPRGRVHALRGVSSTSPPEIPKFAKVDIAQDPDAELHLSEAELQTAHKERGPASVRALRALKAVVENAHNIELDHYITYHAHYELGRLYVCFGNLVKAREHLKLVASGKSLEPANKSRKVRTLRSEFTPCRTEERARHRGSTVCR